MIEEITDMFTEEAYSAKQDGKFLYKKGKLLRFEFEGSITELVITRIDRKNKRMWARHTRTGTSFDDIESHVDHLIDSSREAIEEFGTAFCQDCEVPIIEPSTQDGEVKAINRKQRKFNV